MAVEATHPTQTLPFAWAPVQDFCNNHLTPQEMQFPEIPSFNFKPAFYQPDSFPAKTSINTVESGLTYNLPANSRKRSLDLMNSMSHQMYVPSNNTLKALNNGLDSPFPSLLGDEILPQIHQQHQFEIDNILAQHTKKMRMELHERQNQQAKVIATVVAEKAISKLREKDEQIQKMAKYNLALQERVKCLIMENQLWRDVAQSNEAQAQSLRSDLEQVLAHAGNQVVNAAEEEDAQSCCGSSGDVAGGEEKKMCKMCGERESSVLLLPCRHLCLCGVCGSGSTHVHACPVCNSTTNATLHVNFSP